MRITAELLRDKGACTFDIKRFEKQWPDGCNVTRKNCEIAFGPLGMDVNWAAGGLLSPEAYYEYEKTRNQAYHEYQDVRDKAWTKYLTGRNAKYSKFHKVRARAYAEYHKVCIEAFYQAAKG